MTVSKYLTFTKYLLIGLVLCITPLKAENLSDYKLGTGDKLSINVFGEEELSVEVKLSDAGTISYPFLGEIEVLGMTTGSLSKLIKKELADGYLVNPSVNVEVMSYREFYINGEIEKPGAYPYLPGLTLQKAAALAGGFTERASGSKRYVIHDGETQRKKIAVNDTIQPGDVITIEESFF